MTFGSVLGPELKISVFGTGPAEWRCRAARELPGVQVTVATGASRAQRLPVRGSTWSPIGKGPSQQPIVQSERRSRGLLQPQVRVWLPLRTTDTYHKLSANTD